MFREAFRNTKLQNAKQLLHIFFKVTQIKLKFYFMYLDTTMSELYILICCFQIIFVIYSEKHLKDIKILSYILHSRTYVPIERCKHLIVQNMRNFSYCKMQSVLHWSCSKWATSWENQQNDCAPSENSDQPGHPPSLIRVFAVRLIGSLGHKLASCGQRRLWSDWVDTRTDLSLRWLHSHFVGFVISRLKCSYPLQQNFTQT